MILIFILTIAVKELLCNPSQPYRIITSRDGFNLTTVEVESGTNISLNCKSIILENTVNQRILWIRKDKQFISTKEKFVFGPRLNFTSITSKDEGTYMCINTANNSTKIVKIVVKGKLDREKRSDLNEYEPPRNLPSFEEILAMQREFLEKYPVEPWTPSYDTPYHKNDDLDRINLERSRNYNTNIGIVIAGVAIVIIVLVAVFICRYYYYKNRQGPQFYNHTTAVNRQQNYIAACQVPTTSLQSPHNGVRPLNMPTPDNYIQSTPSNSARNSTEVRSLNTATHDNYMRSTPSTSARNSTHNLNDSNYGFKDQVDSGLPPTYNEAMSIPSASAPPELPGDGAPSAPLLKH